MKAAVIRAPGEGARYDDFQDPLDREGRLLVELVAAGIHPVVRALASGRHYASGGQWPLVPGVDAVVRSADGALAYSGFPQTPFGTLAERISVPSFLWIPLPEGADPARVAGGVNPGLASWLPLRARIAEIGRLDTVLVLGAAGMAGLLAVQNARILGATRVVGVGRDAQSTVELTGDSERDAGAIARSLEGTSPDIGLDFLWGEPAQTAFAALARRGGFEADAGNITYVQIGSAAGADASIPAELLRSRNLRITGSGVGSASLAGIVAEIPGYIALIADGTVDVPVRTFPLSEVGEAWKTAARGRPRVVVCG